MFQTLIDLIKGINESIQESINKNYLIEAQQQIIYLKMLLDDVVDKSFDKNFVKDVEKEIRDAIEEALEKDFEFFKNN